MGVEPRVHEGTVRRTAVMTGAASVTASRMAGAAAARPPISWAQAARAGWPAAPPTETPSAGGGCVGHGAPSHGPTEKDYRYAQSARAGEAATASAAKGAAVGVAAEAGVARAGVHGGGERRLEVCTAHVRLSG